MYMVNQTVLSLMDEINGLPKEETSESVEMLKNALKKYMEENGLNHE
jgi:hypothetical protein